MTAFNTTYPIDQIDPTCWIAPGAVIVGDVTLDAETSVWFQAVLRGDTTLIHIGARTNIQDGAILHADPGFPAIVGEGVTIGHGAIVHGATIEDNVTVGMRAVVMNGCTVGENSIIGAGAILPQGKTYPPGVLILGLPGKVIRELTPGEIQANRYSADTYVERSRAFMTSA